MRKKGLLPLILGLLLLTVFASAAFAPEFFTSYSQKELFTKWLPMSREHLLGTNAMGYDILTELIYGARQTLLVGILSSILTLILGAGIGILGSFHGWVGQLFNGLIQIFVLLPKLITLIVLATFFGSSAAHLIVLIAAFSWVGTARAVRAKVLQLHTQPFIESCRILGYSRTYIAVRHILPNLSDVLLSRFLLGVNSCIMMESTLSFLGLGDLYRPTWETMVNFAYKRGAFLRGCVPISAATRRVRHAAVSGVLSHQPLADRQKRNHFGGVIWENTLRTFMRHTKASLRICRMGLLTRTKFSPAVQSCRRMKRFWSWRMRCAGSCASGRQLTL